ncbi:hypothetical protein H1P_750015 [Hyella patelloides LEGE 07179]|uniref:Uncharacterized protein n=1 Tax=Hyella patelloides LEGE 07179 TaxID=945734 RepID=A0A563W3R4_9CYAN|nr:tetratricopeptide repeat protein [Hyella patelloides]VEP18331.1 hypothetical protein H1P_750015 [Hyella patelloides LEGE 07179]
MLQWFNKRATSSSSSEELGGNRQYSPSSASALTEEDYEFLFNQLLDGVAHGWHLGKIIKFFNNIESRSHPSEWVTWLGRFEHKIVYSDDPSQRRVGAIMMRFSELTQSHSELQQLSEVFQRIGKKLFIGSTFELIWEYDGLDRVTEEDIDLEVADTNEPELAITDSEDEVLETLLGTNLDSTVEVANEPELAITDSEDEVLETLLGTNLDSTVEVANEPELAITDSEDEAIGQTLDDFLNSTLESISESEEITLETSKDAIGEVDTEDHLNSTTKFTEQLTKSPDLIAEAESTTEFTEQPTKSPDLVAEAESTTEFTEQPTKSPDLIAEAESTTEFTEQPTKSPDLVAEAEFSLEKMETAKDKDAEDETNSIESLTALTEQLTVLQGVPSESEEDTTEKQTQELFAKFTEQQTVSPDLMTESELPEKELNDSESSEQETKSLESLEALTKQLTAIQDTISEEVGMDNQGDTHIEVDSESTLIASETEQNDSSTSLPVASFIEATKTLVPQTKNKNTTPLTWEEFISVLEQDPNLAQQIAQYLKISSTNPQDIVQAAINRLTKQEEAILSPATVELVESWFNLGLKQASAEDFQSAIASWDQALKLNPNLSEAWHNRGSALGRLGKYEQAIQSFNQAIKIAPERYQAWNDRAHALYQIQKWEQAVENWDKAISLMSDNYQFWYNRGCALEQLQRYDESISSYEKALEIKPDFQPARSRYINLVTENSSSPAN